MASFWFWLLTIIGSLIGGAIAIAIIFFTATFIKDFLMKKKLPKKKKDIGKFIKENPDKFDKKYPGKPAPINKEEEEKNAQQRRAKFREFEKLRRAELKSRTSKDKGRKRESSKSSGSSKRNEQVSESGLLQNEPSADASASSKKPTETERKPGKDGPRVKLD